MADKLKAGGDSRRNWRTINQCVDRLDALDTLGTDGRAGVAELRRRPRDVGAAGWNWAEPKTYDFNRSYLADEIVVVLPLSLAVTDGIPSEDNEDGSNVKALPGIWICLGDVSPVNHGTEESPDMGYHVPQWPAPAPDDPDAVENFWWPLAFYPQTLTDCSNGQEVDRVYNAADKPVEVEEE